MKYSSKTATLSPFEKLTNEELTNLELFKKPFALKRGEFLNVQHTEANGLYFISKGYAKIVWPEKNGKESIIKIVGPGEMTGYRCLFSEKFFRATAVSLSSPIEGYFIPKNNFFELLKNNHAFNLEILESMGREIRLAENRLRSFAQKSVRERMAEAILDLNNICGVSRLVDEQIVLDIHLTREELSSWIGSAKETTVRCLSDMREDGILDQCGNYITINNLAALEALAIQS